MPEHFIGIDVGTTATKAVVLTERGVPIRRTRVRHAVELPIDSGRVDPLSWWASVQEACRELDAADLELAGIGLSIHCPVGVPMDDDGGHLSAGYRFEAPGLQDITRSLIARLSPEEVTRLGNRVTPATFMAAAYLLIQAEEPEVSRALRFLGSVGTYIGHRLTGEWAMDPTQASYFGCFDLTDDWTWEEALAERLGIPAGVLPPVRASLSTLGTLTTTAALALGLQPHTPVVVGGGDTACAAFAAGIERDHARLFSLGTTHVITEHGFAPTTDGLHLQRSYLRPGQWLRHGVCNGGLALSVAARMLGYGTGSDAVQALVDRAMVADVGAIQRAPWFIPHVRTERGPFWIGGPRAGFVGMTADTDEDAAAWAAVEGVLFTDRLVLESFSSRTSHDVILAGDVRAGGAFAQLASDLCAVPMSVSNESHLPAVGAALLAAEGVGSLLSFEQNLERFKPRPELGRLIESRWNGFTEARTQFLRQT